MSLKNSLLIFIDTNVLLDFYRMRGESSNKLLGRLDSLHKDLVMTYQVEMEFMCNRQRVMVEFLEELKNCVRRVSAPAFLAESKTNKALATLLGRTKSQVAKLRQRLIHLIEHPSKDPVLVAANRMFRVDSPLNLRREDEARVEVKEKAATRFRLGYPPRKKGDTSMGDALNWEWILRCMGEHNRDVVIVSRDSDYGVEIDGKSYPNDWLVHEAKQRARQTRKIKLVSRLSAGLKEMKIEVSAEEIEQEKKVAEQVPSADQQAGSLSAFFPPGNPLDFLYRIDPDAEAKRAVAEMVGRLRGTSGSSSALNAPVEL